MEEAPSPHRYAEAEGALAPHLVQEDMWVGCTGEPSIIIVIIVFLLLLLNLCLRAGYECACSYVWVFIWRSEDSFWESDVIFLLVWDGISSSVSGLGESKESPVATAYGQQGAQVLQMFVWLLQALHSEGQPGWAGAFIYGITPCLQPGCFESEGHARDLSSLLFFFPFLLFLSFFFPH